MIKNYNKFNEGINQYLKGPSEEEVLQKLSKLSPDLLLQKSISIELKLGILEAFKRGVDISEYSSSITKILRILNMTGEQLFNFMVENNLNINYILYVSVNVGYLDGVKYALEKGGDIHYRNEELINIASSEIHEPNINLIKYLIDNGANINAHATVVLRNAILKNHYEIVKLLLERGADVFSMRNRSLVLAKRQGNKKMIKLIEFYMDKNKEQQ